MGIPSNVYIARLTFQARRTLSAARACQDIYL